MTYPRRDDLSGNWTRLYNLVMDVLDSDDAPKYMAMMKDLQLDKADPEPKFTLIPGSAPAVDQESCLLGWYRAPAAKRNHHAFEGGLVFHQLEMWWCWTKMRDYILERCYEGPEVAVNGNPHLNDARILKAILHHDLHKAAYDYRLLLPDPWQTEYTQSIEDGLLTNDTKSLRILMNYGINLDTEQMNMLIQAEGGYSPIRPKYTSVAAKIAYLLDELSGNVLSRIHTDKWLSHEDPGLVRKR